MPSPSSRHIAIPGDPTLHWRKNDFMSYAIGHDEQAVMVRGKRPVRIPGFVADFLAGCDRFRPMEAHIEEHASKYAWGVLEVDALTSWLPAATECGALVSSANVLACLGNAAGSAKAPPAVISTIGLPTGGDRTDLVARAIGSFSRNAAAYGRKVRFLVSDGSPALVHRTAFRQGCEQWTRELGAPVLYGGEEEKRRLAAALIQRGCDAESVEFALFDPLQTGFTCGANRNAVLLHQAGSAFACIDDDVVCQLLAAPPAAERLRLFSSCDPFARWFFPDRESSLAHPGAVDADFLASHEAMLGRSLGELGADLKTPDLDLSLAGDEVLRRLTGGDGRVRATFFGHIGDPGIPTSTYHLFCERENRARLTSSEDHYRAALASRSLLAIAPCRGIGDSSTSPGMAMALDHRELLPPFFPVLHAEDFVFGATLWHSDGRAFLGHCPLAIRHEPRPGKTILQSSQLDSVNRAVVFEFAHLIRRAILRFQRNETDSIEGRMYHLGAHLRGIAEQPLIDFVETIRSQILEQESARLDYLEQQLRDDTETAEFWRHDLEAYLAHVREALTYDDFDIPFDLKGPRSDEENRTLMREMFRRFGKLLQDWPAMVAAAREINQQAEWAEAFGPARPV